MPTNPGDPAAPTARHPRAHPADGPLLPLQAQLPPASLATGKLLPYASPARPGPGPAPSPLARPRSQLGAFSLSFLPGVPCSGRAAAPCTLTNKAASPCRACGHLSVPPHTRPGSCSACSQPHPAHRSCCWALVLVPGLPGRAPHNKRQHRLAAPRLHGSPACAPAWGCPTAPAAPARRLLRLCADMLRAGPSTCSRVRVPSEQSCSLLCNGRGTGTLLACAVIRASPKPPPAPHAPSPAVARRPWQKAEGAVGSEAHTPLPHACPCPVPAAAHSRPCLPRAEPRSCSCPALPGISCSPQGSWRPALLRPPHSCSQPLGPEQAVPPAFEGRAPPEPPLWQGTEHSCLPGQSEPRTLPGTAQCPVPVPPLPAVRVQAGAPQLSATALCSSSPHSVCAGR